MRIELAACYTKAQRLQAQHAIVENKVTGEIGEGQILAVNDALAAEGHVGIHGPPTLGTKFLDRQHLARRLLAGPAPSLLLRVGVCTDQRRKVLEQQLIGNQIATEFGPWLFGGEGEVAVNITVTDLAVEALVAKQRPPRLM
ncbi:hypothetical protein D3C77_481980 [compost metagenome]